MYKKTKRIHALLISAVMLLALAAVPATPVQAVKFGDTRNVPRGYWDVFTPYEAALKAKDPAKIAATGEKLISFWLGSRTAEQCAADWIKDVAGHGYEINDLWSVSYEVAKQYEGLKDYTNAARVYKIALAFVDAYKVLMTLNPGPGGNPGNMDFARIEIQNKLAAWDVTVVLYAEIDARNGLGDTSFLGAKHEPKTGIFYGEPPGPSALMGFTKKPSATVIYVIFETEKMEERVNHDLRLNEQQNGYAQNGYSVIEVAWNFIGEGSTLASVPGEGAKVTAAAQYLQSLGMPILLRVGAEMNVWGNKANPEEFKTAFRFIANIMRQYAPNVALVWSVNDVSAQGLNYEMFYPGAEYVDWVGISLYVRRYFQGNPNTSNADSAIWGTGSFANPIKHIEELVKLYGTRHPIMISEGGVTLHNASNNENLTNWALPRIRQLYSYIPMIFPQVKAIFWFNTNVQAAYRYDFTDSPLAKDLYRQLTSSGYFLGKGQTEATVTYKKLGTATMPAASVTLLTYAPFFMIDDISIEYWVDGKWADKYSNIPYRFQKDFSGEADGAHKLEVRVLSGGSVLRSIEYNISKSGGNVTVSSGTITTPTPPPGLTVNQTKSVIYVNGVQKSFEAYLINDENYLKLRDFAYVLNGTEKQFNAEAVDGVAVLTSGQPYKVVGGEMVPGDGKPKTAVLNTTMKFTKDGSSVEIRAYLINGNNFLRVKDMLRLFNVGWSYDTVTQAIWLDTSKPFTE